LPDPDQAAFSNQLVEQTKRIEPIQACSTPYVGILDCPLLSDRADQILEFIPFEPKSGWGLKGSLQLVDRAPTLTTLDEESGVAQAPECLSRNEAINMSKLPDTSVCELLATGRMDQENSIHWLDLATVLDLAHPGPLLRSHTTPNRQCDLDRVPRVGKGWGIEQLSHHRVLHDVDASSRVLCEAKATH